MKKIAGAILMLAAGITASFSILCIKVDDLQQSVSGIYADRIDYRVIPLMILAVVFFIMGCFLIFCKENRKDHIEN